MPGEGLIVGRNLVIPESEIVESASRASGPGGQHVNKTNTRVTLRFNLHASSVLTASQRERLLRALSKRLAANGDLIVHADRTRSRSRNREKARERIVELIVMALRVPTARRETRPTRGSKLRLRSAKSRRGDQKRQRRRMWSDDE
jgi:ribosome-associated protein